MEIKKIAIVVTPGKNNLEYIDNLYDGVIENTNCDYQLCAFLESSDQIYNSRHDILFRIINKDDVERCNRLYRKEGRSDISAFATMSKFFLVKYFSEFTHILFLEVDQKVKGDIKNLFEITNQKISPIHAARSRNPDLSLFLPESYKKLHPGKKYYNTGVLLINTKIWSDLDLSQKCFDELEKNLNSKERRIEFYSQGAINNALNNYIEEIDYCFNTTGLGQSNKIDRSIIDNAVILHWTGSRKPWKKYGFYKYIYFKKYSFSQKIIDNINLMIYDLYLLIKRIKKRFKKLNI